MAASPIYLEVGSKKVFACSLVWPGWARAGRSEEAAMEALSTYAARYAPVARAAGARFPKSAGDDFEVIERLPGDGGTEFGVPGKVPSADAEPLTAAQARRLVALVEASWATLAEVAAGAPAELRKGPRGGGRDRDKIVAHVAEADFGYARQIGLAHKPSADVLADKTAVAAIRAAMVEVLSAARSGDPLAGKRWPARYAARRIAWHALDHAWEIEDRSDLDLE